jgi:hypothetical protein
MAEKKQATAISPTAQVISIMACLRTQIGYGAAFKQYKKHGYYCNGQSLYMAGEIQPRG